MTTADVSLIGGGAAGGRPVAIDWERLARQAGRPRRHVEAAVALLDAGNTVPFIARYRKEQTGGMDDAELRALAEAVEKARALEQRRADVLRLLAEQGHLTPELEREVRAAETQQRLEDLYRPFRPKRRTRAAAARELGLEPLARWLLARPDGSPEEEAAKYVGEGVPDVEAALQGARDIVAELLSDHPALRGRLREMVGRTASLRTTLLESERAPQYEAYADYAEPVRRMPPHRVLAVNRGEREQALKVTLEVDEERLTAEVEAAALAMADAASGGVAGAGAPGRRGASARSSPRRSPADEHLRAAARDAFKRLLAPSIEREIRAELTEKAQEQALNVFRENLRSLLLQAPLRGHVVMGLDPAYRTGVKVAVVDPTGRLLATDVVYPTPPHNRAEEATARLTALTDQFGVTAVAIGNGTASRETEAFVAAWLKTLPSGRRPAYAIVDEAGASVYSASEAARQEFPDLDVSQRSAVSIARRLQDPLAELVKIEPRSLGVGQYQHDVDPKRLEEQLAGVVEASVNQVGVDLNTASVQLLSYVAGLTLRVAENIVARRDAQGPFRSRRELLAVERLGPRTFEQCAGFLLIPDAPNPLDRTPIHPESYHVAEGLLARLGLALDDVGDGAKVRAALAEAERAGIDLEQAAAELGCGVPTLRDIVEALKRPGRDPREDLPPPALRSDVLSLDDLREGMVLTGTVRNVVDFGAFVDIGVGQDGLVHISELSDRFVKHPLDVVAVGDTVSVRVLGVDKRRGRISLSMKGLGAGRERSR